MARQRALRRAGIRRRSCERSPRPAITIPLTTRPAERANKRANQAKTATKRMANESGMIDGQSPRAARAKPARDFHSRPALPTLVALFSRTPLLSSSLALKRSIRRALSLSRSRGIGDNASRTRRTPSITRRATRLTCLALAVHRRSTWATAMYGEGPAHLLAPVKPLWRRASAPGCFDKMKNRSSARHR